MSAIDLKPRFWRFLDERNLWLKFWNFWDIFFSFWVGYGRSALYIEGLCKVRWHWAMRARDLLQSNLWDMIFDGKQIKLEDMTEHPFIYFYRNLFIFARGPTGGPVLLLVVQLDLLFWGASHLHLLCNCLFLCFVQVHGMTFNCQLTALHTAAWHRLDIMSLLHEQGIYTHPIALVDYCM